MLGSNVVVFMDNFVWIWAHGIWLIVDICKRQGVVVSRCQSREVWVDEWSVGVMWCRAASRTLIRCLNPRWSLPGVSQTTWKHLAYRLVRKGVRNWLAGRVVLKPDRCSRGNACSTSRNPHFILNFTFLHGTKIHLDVVFFQVSPPFVRKNRYLFNRKPLCSGGNFI